MELTPEIFETVITVVATLLYSAVVLPLTTFFKNRMNLEGNSARSLSILVVLGVGILGVLAVNWLSPGAIDLKTFGVTSTLATGYVSQIAYGWMRQGQQTEKQVKT